jgi:Inner membrane protein YgaP-like, transmembrane domain
MNIERALRMLAGLVVLVSLALAHWVSPLWLWLTVFAGLNLLQSAFTNWCPVMPVLRVLGLRDTDKQHSCCR